MKAYRRYIRTALFLIVFLGMIILPLTQLSVPVQAATKPTLSVSQITLYAGYQPHTIQIRDLAQTAKVTYTSSKPKIAVVSAKGKITPKAKGTAKITVVIEQNKKTFVYDLKVTVKNPYIEITDKTKELVAEESYQFRAKLYGAKGKIQWKVSEPGIADFDSATGILYAFNEGTVTITATLGNMSKSYIVVVKKKPIKEFIIEGPSEMIEGETFEYLVNNLEDCIVEWWDLSDSDIAELNFSKSSGQKITALKAGTVKLIAQTPGYYGEKSIQVKKLEIIGGSYLKVSESTFYTLNSIQMLKKVSWHVEDQEIAEIITDDSTNGIRVKGLKEGNTVLSARYWTYMEDHTIRIPITVGEAPDFVITGNSQCGVIDTQDYSVNLPEGTFVEWSISDPSIADFIPYGVSTRLTAWKQGTFTLTASLGDKKAQLVVTVVDENLTYTDNKGSDFDPANLAGNDVPSDTTVVDDTPTTPSGSGNSANSSKKVTKDSVIYELRDTYAYVAGVTLGTQSVDLPSEIEGLPVSVIGMAFGQCPTLKSITWTGKSITLENNCFASNTGITSISLKGSITIGNSAFSGCTTLSNLEFSGEVKSVGTYAFHNCTSLTTLTFPGTETVFNGEFPFRGCSSMKSMRFDSKVVFANSSNEAHFFYGIWDEDIKECHVEELYLNIDQISTDRLLIYVSHNLKKLTLVNTTKICSNTVGYEPKALQELVLPDTLTVIPRDAFTHCEGLQKVSIPASVVKIENYAFSYCTGLKSINIPSSVVNIGDSAFGYCSSLAEITAGINRSREVNVEKAFKNTKFGSIQGCYLNNAIDILSGDQYKAIQKAVAVLDTVKASSTDEYQIIKGCHDWIANNTVYDERLYSHTEPQQSYSEEGVFVYGTAVCEGYTEAFQTLMDLAGINCFIVTGTAIGEDHAWNIVQLGSNYYHIDSTWNDPDSEPGKIYYDYFLISDSRISKNHETWFLQMGGSAPSCPVEYSSDDDVLKDKMSVYYID